VRKTASFAEGNEGSWNTPSTSKGQLNIKISRKQEGATGMGGGLILNRGIMGWGPCERNKVIRMTDERR